MIRRLERGVERGGGLLIQWYVIRWYVIRWNRRSLKEKEEKEEKE